MLEWLDNDSCASKNLRCRNSFMALELLGTSRMVYQCILGLIQDILSEFFWEYFHHFFYILLPGISIIFIWEFLQEQHQSLKKIFPKFAQFIPPWIYPSRNSARKLYHNLVGNFFKVCFRNLRNISLEVYVRIPPVMSPSSAHDFFLRNHQKIAPKICPEIPEWFFSGIQLLTFLWR